MATFSCSALKAASAAHIYILSAVNYDLATTGLILIRVYIYPGPGVGALQLISEPFFSGSPFLGILEISRETNWSRWQKLPTAELGHCKIVGKVFLKSNI